MKKILIVIFTVALVLITGCSKDKEEPKKEEPIELEPVEVVEEPEIIEIERSATLGFPSEELEEPDNFFGIMVENSPASRPHTGLVNADIVYEMEVEYQITRFFALFQHDIPEKIGPARSARHYYLPVTESWNAPYIHYGGSKFAYADFPELKVEHFDGTKKGYKFFTRDNSRKAPHNAYLITDKLPEFENKSVNPHFGYDEEATYTGEPNKEVNLSYSNFNDVMYLYNTEDKMYYRHLEGEAHIDRATKEQIKAKNVFVIFAAHEDLKTSSGHIDIHLDKEGTLHYYVEGQKVVGKWKNEDGKIVFYDGNHEPLKALPGKTWIQVFDQDKATKVTEK